MHMCTSACGRLWGSLVDSADNYGSVAESLFRLSRANAFHAMDNVKTEGQRLGKRLCPDEDRAFLV